MMSVERGASFDLTREPWVPVIVAGARELMSLRDLFGRAHEVDGLALDNPLEAAAVLRQVLLAVYLDALGAPRRPSEWADRWEARAVDASGVNSYLDRHAHRFDLFHPETPFAQVGGLRTAKDETKPVSLLVPSIATGNNVPLFTARTEAMPPALTPAEAVRAVLATHCWDTAAIKSGAADDEQAKAGKTTGNPTGPLGSLGVVFPLGRTLAETLLLNTRVLRQGLRPTDRPQWCAGSASGAWEPRPALGLLDLLTWQSRRIRLIPDLDEHGQLVVRRVVLAAGDRLDPIPHEVEPHTAWRTVDKRAAGQPPVRPVRHVAGRAAWRGLEPLLATRPDFDTGKFTSAAVLIQLNDLRQGGYVPADLPLRVLTVGVEYGNQSAVVENVMSDLTPLPVTALDPGSPVRQLLDTVVKQADDLRIAANRLGDDLRLAVGAEKLPWDRGQRLGDLLVHRFTPVVHRMLAGLQRQPDRVQEAEEAWRVTARRLALETAEPVLAAAPPGAFLGREVKEQKREKTTVYRLSVAERWFKQSVNNILGPATVRPPHLDRLGRSV